MKVKFVKLKQGAILDKLTIGKVYDVLNIDCSDRYIVINDAGVESYFFKEEIEIIEGDNLTLKNIPLPPQTDQHYNNTNGSLYKFAQDHELNAWEFDIIKRITRCRKKGQFKEDLEKTKRVIDLYLKEFEA